MIEAGVPHIGGPVLAPGALTVLIEDRPAAITCGLCRCQSPTPDVLAMGSPNVEIEGEMAVRVGDQTFHGGMVTTGSGTVEIGVPGDGVVSQRAVAIGRALAGKSSRRKKSKSAPNASSKGGEQAEPPTNQDQTHPNQTKCRVLDVHASCMHDGRRSGTQRILEVVPTSLTQPDEISLVALLEDECGQHPLWTIDGSESAKGDTVTMKALSPITASLFPISATPRHYIATCRSCNSEGGRIDIFAYPSSSQSVGYQFDRVIKQKYVDLVRKNALKLQEFLRKSPLLLALLSVFSEEDKYNRSKKLKVNSAKPNISATAGWKEIENDYRAFFEYEVTLAANPLLQVEVIPLRLTPLKIVKLVRRITKYIRRMRIPKLSWVAGWIEFLGEKLDQYIKLEVFSLKLVLGSSIDLRFTRQSPELNLYVPQSGPGATGAFEIVAEYDIQVRDGPKKYVTFSGSVDIKCSLRSSFAVDAVGIKSGLEWIPGTVMVSPLRVKAEDFGIDAGFGEIPVVDLNSLVGSQPDTTYLVKWDDKVEGGPEDVEGELGELSFDLSDGSEDD